MNKRFFFSDNSTISDWTPALSNYKTGSKVFPFVAGEDCLIIGSRLPFNHFYVKMNVLNVTPSTMSISYWAESGWRSAVEIIDETSAMTSSGFVSFTPDKNTNWKMESESSSIPELSNVIVYDYYWLKISFTNSLSLTTAIGWIGNIFSNDDDLAAEFPDLVKSSVLTSYQSGKTDWQEQHVKAAEIIEQDLINRGIIDGSESILDREWYRNASVQKTAEIIFGAFGDDYTDQRLSARDEYKLRLVKRLARVDVNNTAIEEPFERKQVTGFLCR
jgi:hypothetical protein